MSQVKGSKRYKLLIIKSGSCGDVRYNIGNTVSSIIIVE